MLEPPDIAVVGEANDGGECPELARQVRPDIVLMDIGLPVLGGIDATRALVAEDPAIKVVALSTSRIVVWSCRCSMPVPVAMSSNRRGATTAAGDPRRCLRPHLPLPGRRRGARRKPARQESPDSPPLEPIGRREREVLQLLADGHTSPEIGKRLHIATSTVEVHRRNLMRKLELHSIAELTKYAVRHG